MTEEKENRQYIIHPTAIIDPQAELGEGVKVGPYAVIGPHVRIGAGTEIMSHVVIDGWTTIGEECRFFPFSVIVKSIGFAPSVKYPFGASLSTIRNFP